MTEFLLKPECILNNSNVMDFVSGRTFWKCIGKLVLSFVCVYLLLVYIDLGNLFKDLDRNNEVVLSTNHMDIKHNRRTDTKGTEHNLTPTDTERREAMIRLQDHHMVGKIQDPPFVKGKVARLYGEHGAISTTYTNRNNGTEKVSNNCRLYPDIILVGFEKCGTITFISYFGRHPEIFIPKTGVIPYFDPVIHISFKTFTKHTPCTPPRKLKLEKLSVFGSPVKVFETLPNVKLLAIVREPVERAMSHYVHLVAEGKENPDTFDSIIKTLLDGKTHKNKTVANSGLFRDSTYIDRLEKWIETFGRDRIHLVDGDNFVKHPAFELNKIENFLNISQYFSDDHFVYNPEKQFYCLKDTGCMGTNKGRPHPKMTDNTRERLQAYFKPFNEKLFLALGQRFSWNY